MTTARRLTTELARPGQPRYDTATAVFNLSAPPRPAAAVTAGSVEDVVSAVRRARADGMPVRVHTTGHAAPTARPMQDALLIRTNLAGGVVVDPRRRVARVPAGTQWGEVARAAAPFGLVAPHGSAPNVGVVGFLLRGGVSFYGRRVGLAANSVRAVELVLADGEVCRADPDHDAELFWALRGGGGGFGVVTAVEVALYPVTQVITGAAFWSAADADVLLRVWRQWAAQAPRTAATSVRLMQLPQVPEVPPQLSAGPVLCVAGAVASWTADVRVTERQAEELLGPLRAVAAPVMDTWHLGGPTDVLDAHMDPADPIDVLGDHMLLRDFDEDAAAAFLRVTGPGSGSPLVAVELRQLGAALAEADPGGGALDHLDADVSYMAAGLPGSPADAEAIDQHCAVIRQALTPWDTGRTAPTFVENYWQPQRHLDEQRVARVDRVRVQVDPDGVFRGDIVPHATALP